MFTVPAQATQRTRLAESIRQSATLTPKLMSEFVAVACKRAARLNKAGLPVSRLDALLKESAWTEAALALAEIELPGWRLRRLVQDDDVWICSLSRRPHLPIELDDTADGAHGCLPLAILAAILQAQMHLDAKPVFATVSSIDTMQSQAMCCDNFA